MSAADGEGASFHDGAVAVECDSLDVHAPELFEDARLVIARAFGEAGVGGSGAEASYSYAGIADFVGERLGEGNHIGLGRIVDGHERSRLESGGGCDIHDASAMAGEHGRQE